MPKYLELSANVDVKSSSTGGCEDLAGKKVKPYIVDGVPQGYVITSPYTGRNIVVGNDNKFNGDYTAPTFARCFCAPEDPDHGYPEENLMIMLGKVGYLERVDGGLEIVGCLPMVDCTWEPEEGR